MSTQTLTAPLSVVIRNSEGKYFEMKLLSTFKLADKVSYSFHLSFEGDRKEDRKVILREAPGFELLKSKVFREYMDRAMEGEVCYQPEPNWKVTLTAIQFTSNMTEFVISFDFGDDEEIQARFSVLERSVYWSANPDETELVFASDSEIGTAIQPYEEQGDKFSKFMRTLLDR